MAFTPLAACLALAVVSAMEPACPTDDARFDDVNDPVFLLQVRLSMLEASAVGAPPPALQLGEKAEEVKREASYYVAPHGFCSAGTLITDAQVCQAAYDAIKADYTVYPAKRGLVKGYWNGVPWGCSLQFKGSYVDGNGDESPHWNTYHFTDNSRLTSGEFLALCQGEPDGPHPQYVLMPEHATSCPSGADVTQANCMEAYNVMKDGRTVYPALRGLVSGSWNGVPRGCSLQFKGSFVAEKKDESPHWNVHSFTDNSRVATGEFRVICKWHPPLAYYIAPQGNTCSTGLITDPHACQEAYTAVKADYTVYPAKRGLVGGGWNGVPVGCSLQFKGSYVDGNGDESPHWNTYNFTDNSRLTSGEFRALCQGEPRVPDPEYVLMPESITSCPYGTDVTNPADCMAAYNAIKDDRTVHPARRGLVWGSWNGVPRGCSLQFKGSYVTLTNDESPHWNTRSFTDNSRVTNGEFRILCKSRWW